MTPSISRALANARSLDPSFTIISSGNLAQSWTAVSEVHLLRQFNTQDPMGSMQLLGTLIRTGVFSRSKKPTPTTLTLFQTADLRERSTQTAAGFTPNASDVKASTCTILVMTWRVRS